MIRKALAPFVQRHSRFISVVGALVVFVMFIVKEEFRDYFASAQTAYLMRSDLASINGKLNNLGGRPNAAEKVWDSCDYSVNAEKDLRENGLPATNNVKKQHDEFVAEEALIGRSLNNLLKLEEKVPTANLWTLQGMSRRLNKVEEDNPHDPKSLILSSLTICGTKHDLTRIDPIILAEAETALGNYQESYKATRTFSIVLYAFGWGLGLLGTLFGVKGLSASE